MISFFRHPQSHRSSPGEWGMEKTYFFKSVNKPARSAIDRQISRSASQTLSLNLPISILTDSYEVIASRSTVTEMKHQSPRTPRTRLDSKINRVRSPNLLAHRQGIPSPSQIHRARRSLIFSSAIVVFGLAIALSGRVATLTCDRPETVSSRGHCEWVNSGLLNRQTWQIPLTSLHEARVIRSRLRNGSRYKVRLLRDGDTTDFPSSWNSPRHANQIADRINKFLTDSQSPSLQVRFDNRWHLFVVGSVIIGWGTISSLLALTQLRTTLRNPN